MSLLPTPKISYVLFANKKERDAMADFLARISWTALAESELSPISAVPLSGEEIGLAPALARRSIGFRHEGLPQRAWAMLGWLAHRSSEKINNWGVIVHGDEEIPVVVREEGPEFEHDALIVSRDGVLRHWIDRPLPTGPDYLSQESFMSHLTLEWSNQVAPPVRKKAILKTKEKVAQV